MLAFAAVLTACLLLVGFAVLAIAAYLRAEEARAALRRVSSRLAAVEKQLGIERPPHPAARAREPAARPPPGEQPSVEERIALAWLARVGVLLLGVGGIVFLVYGPAGSAGVWRLAVAATFGAVALAFAELHRGRARPLFNQAVLGLGAAALQLSAVASHVLYQVASPRLALAAAAAVFAVGCLLAVRHRTEVPLFVSLLGALAAPSLLWRDAPAAGLFLYLLGLSAAALAVAARQGFRYAFWLAPVGGAAALALWYARSFEAGPGSPHELLSARAVPLLFAAAFTATWLAAGALAPQPGRRRLGAGPFLVLSLSLAHGLFAALVHDQPPALAAAFAVLALAGAWLLRDSPLGLLAPLGVSFLVLLGAVHPKAPAAATFVPLALWGGAYGAALLRPPGRTGLVLSAIAGTAFLLVAGELLAPFRWRAFGLVTLAWSLAYALVAMVRRASLLLAATGLVAFLALAGASYPLSDRGDHVLLAICGGWVAVHLGGLAYRMRSQQEVPDWPHLATSSGTAVSYGLLVLFLAPREPLLRGLLAALAGAAHVVLGGMVLGRSPPAGNALQAVAVALFAASAMHVLPGALSTLAWAALATLLVGAGFRRRSRLLRMLGLGLFAVAIARVLVWDLWQRPLQLGVLFAVGALFLAASYLYARLGARLAEALRDEGRGTPGAGKGAAA
jgi:uncharacterized membrane protein